MGAILIICGVFLFISIMAMAMEAAFRNEDEEPKTFDSGEKDGSEKDT